jgi:hypothetical protein
LKLGFETVAKLLVLALVIIIWAGLGSKEGRQDLRDAGVKFGGFESDRMLVGLESLAGRV